MSFCQPCRELVQKHKKATRWVAFLLVMSIFFSALGAISTPVSSIGFCKVYP